MRFLIERFSFVFCSVLILFRVALVISTLVRSSRPALVSPCQVFLVPHFVAADLVPFGPAAHAASRAGARLARVTSRRWLPALFSSPLVLQLFPPVLGAFAAGLHSVLLRSLLCIQSSLERKLAAAALVDLPPCRGFKSSRADFHCTRRERPG
jgi:hypothetical protein